MNLCPGPVMQQKEQDFSLAFVGYPSGQWCVELFSSWVISPPGQEELVHAPCQPKVYMTIVTVIVTIAMVKRQLPNSPFLFLLLFPFAFFLNGRRLVTRWAIPSTGDIKCGHARIQPAISVFGSLLQTCPFLCLFLFFLAFAPASNDQQFGMWN